MTEQEYLEIRLEDQIKWYGRKSEWNQYWYKMLRNAEMILSALIPVALSFFADYFYVRILVGITGAAIAVITGIHSLYGFHENWIEYRSTCETLKHEKYMYLTRSGVYTETNNAFNAFVGRVESIISHENINWAQINKNPLKGNKPND